MAEQQRPTPAQGTPVQGTLPRRSDTLWTTLRRFSRLWGFSLFLLVVVVVFRGILLPFVFAFLLVYLLAPTVARLEPKLGRALAVVVCYVLLLGTLALFFGLLVPALARDLVRLRDTLPTVVAELNNNYLPRGVAWVHDIFGALLPQAAPHGPAPGSELIMVPQPDGTWHVDLERVRLQARVADDGTWILGPPSVAVPSTDLTKDLRDLLASRAEELTGFIGPAIQALVLGVAGFLTSFVITFMLAGFVLVDLARVSQFIRTLVPFEFRRSFDELWIGMDKGLGGVVRGQLLICLVNGVLTFIGLMVFGVKYSILLGVMAALFSLIPIFGTILSSIPILIIATISGSHGPEIGPALGMLAWISGIHLLEANVLNPKIMGDAAHIHPVIVVFALLAGEHMYGLVGALLAIPVTSIVQAMFLHARRHSAVFARDPELSQ